MTTLTRWVLWVAWLATVSLLWLAGALGIGSALATGVASLLLFAWPGHSHRRRRSELRYIEMGKQPVGLP
ncbi:hypothetical protein [Variovorax sp. MHTC-1]|uniref:hypothetical protein n=1 Tax=Variovorax sp. MHTC-1 TaxID=2495593 RepID=UPI000F878CCE|nr:hypothetical protein [Variovorax sp. MHTC-1]RST49169.1 hypothetical protein EJI01_24720 [Variovorax sp. MHTC-1]